MQAVNVTFVAVLATLVAAGPAHAQVEPYPSMAPLASYLMPEADEVALARSAAPKAISESADVMALRKDGYATVSTGSNGFVCLVERGWGGDSTSVDFWNAKQRSPICFNAEAARTVVPIYLMRTRLVLQGKSKLESVHATTAAIDSGQLPALAPGAMCYMMSRQQYLGDADKAWHPHLMFFVPGDAANALGGPTCRGRR